MDSWSYPGTRAGAGSVCGGYMATSVCGFVLLFPLSCLVEVNSMLIQIRVYLCVLCV